MIHINCEIDSSANRITAKSNLGDIHYIFPVEQLPMLETYDFAIWGFLPIAMRLGKDIYIEGSVSMETIKSATEVSSIWANWLPNTYQNISIKAKKIRDFSMPMEHVKCLTFFSGGVDSTYSSYKSYLQNGKDSDCLTVHGMDYKFDDSEKFNALFHQTEVFRKMVFERSRVIKTDAYSLYSRYGCNPKGGHVTHIFALFSCGSLFEEYSQYRIAADYRLDQQFAVHPYGSNTASNRMMQNFKGKLVTLDDDITRSEKTTYLSQSELDLSILSICVNYKFRPKNCGKCSKCMRTKAMFYARNSSIPDIFIDMSFNEGWYSSISLMTKINRAFVQDILLSVENSQNQHNFPDYEKLKLKFLAASQRAAVNPFYGMKLKDFVRAVFKMFLKY